MILPLQPLPTRWRSTRFAYGSTSGHSPFSPTVQTPGRHRVPLHQGRAFTKVPAILLTIQGQRSPKVGPNIQRSLWDAILSLRPRSCAVGGNGLSLFARANCFVRYGTKTRVSQVAVAVSLVWPPPLQSSALVQPRFLPRTAGDLYETRVTQKAHLLSRRPCLKSLDVGCERSFRWSIPVDGRD